MLPTLKVDMYERIFLTHCSWAGYTGKPDLYYITFIAIITNNISNLTKTNCVCVGGVDTGQASTR